MYVRNDSHCNHTNLLYSFILQGLIDAKKELEKLCKKKEQLDETLEKLKQESSMPDYDIKVPLSVRESNTEKLSRSEGELIRIVDAMEILQAISCSK